MSDVRGQLVEPGDGGLHRVVLGLGLGEHVGLATGLAHAQPADHHGQREAVQQQRGDGDEEGQEDDRLPAGTRPAGIANAAASVTTPRIPDQEITAGTCHDGDGSRSRIRRNSTRGM